MCEAQEPIPGLPSWQNGYLEIYLKEKVVRMNEVNEEKQVSPGQEFEFSHGLSAAQSGRPGKSKRSFTLPILALLVPLLCSFCWTSELGRE